MGVGVGWGVERCDKLNGGPTQLRSECLQEDVPKTGQAEYKEVWGGNDIQGAK